MTVLGTRTIYFTDQDGVDQPISIWIELTGLTGLDLDDERFVEENGVIHIHSDQFENSIPASGSDQLQVIFALMKKADIYLQNLAFPDGSEIPISCLQRNDVREPLDIFVGHGGMGVLDFAMSEDGPVPL